MVNFICPKTDTFQKDFIKCEVCEAKEVCVEYNYELIFDKNKKEEK